MAEVMDGVAGEAAGTTTDGAEAAATITVGGSTSAGDHHVIHLAARQRPPSKRMGIPHAAFKTTTSDPRDVESSGRDAGEIR